MAYADANLTNRKFGAGAAVIALEAGLAWAIIAALTLTISPKSPPNITAIPLPPENPVKPHETPVKPVSHQQVPAQRPITDQIDLGPQTMPTFTPDNTFGGGDGGTVDIPRPTPTPAPTPGFTPKAAHPLGNTAGWVSTNDYPTIGLRQEHEGSTHYRLGIDVAGKVTNCTVTTSSGFADLDAATCAVLTRRARFVPATDETGARTSGSFSGTVTWRLPQD